MGFKSIFINEDVEVKPKVKPQVVAATLKKQVKTQEVEESNDTIDSEIKETLLQSLKDNKLSGFDYLKFVGALEEMKSEGGSESSRFKMAFIAAKQLGVDKKKLIDSAQHYLEVLENDSKDFNSNLNSKRTKTIGNSEKRIAELEKAVEEHTKTIEALSAEVDQYKTEQTSLTEEITENRTKLDEKKAAFETTYASVAKEIENNIKKMDQYL